MGTAYTDPSNGRGELLVGCHAIITGASSGLGAEFARQLAPKAASLVLAARNEDPLETMASRLRQSHPSLRVLVSPCDLATADGRAALWRTIDGAGLDPTVLFNNAGLGDYGPFVAADELRLQAQIDLNVTALTLLAQEFARRARGAKAAFRAIINTSSLAASIPLPDSAVYGATKAYVSSFSEALAIELQSADILVLAICPGPTPTNFSTIARRAGGCDTDRTGEDWLCMPPEEVVSSSIAALENGSVRHFPGWKVRLAAFVLESMPRVAIRGILRLRHRRSLPR